MVYPYWISPLQSAFLRYLKPLRTVTNEDTARDPMVDPTSE